ncbi:hypothetical protein VNO80_09831 [Phaseolus coccineus]|uniref:HAT C-terminal dimerisation domain-containing protein n=1 Tax=Phaseolus coccineus TaxID=3886 RepID=A0AAN9NC94_PHACN
MKSREPLLLERSNGNGKQESNLSDSGGVYRMKFHLAQIKNKDIVPCTEVPTDVRDHIQSILSAPKKPKTPKKQKAYQAAISNSQQNSSSASGGLHHSHGYSGQNGIACPSLLFSHPSPCAQPIADDGKMQKQDDADRKLAIFFFHNSIPLSAAKSMYYQEMVDAIAQCGVMTDASAGYVCAGRLLIARLATSDKEKMEITKELPTYINAQGALGTDFAVLGRTLNAPGDWWTSYGYEIPTLQKAAMRILSQPCSSLWYRWNWSTFQSIHNKKQNRVKLEKFSDLVFVHCNLWLKAIFQRREAKSGPIIFDEIDCSCEWPSELESLPPLMDDSWLDDLPLQCRGSP